MKQILTLSLSLSIAFAAQAQLAPQTEAPLYRHMLEVNAQWATVDPALESRTELVHFTSEAERIAQHIHLVSGYLRTHSPQGLSADAATKRTTLLNDLDKYADRGSFPQNHVLPYRNPVFIDPTGTACAVGQLMIESGHRDLAESVSKEMNLAYVHDMKRADVLRWAGQEGFTEDELAWIQPGYPPTVQWDALGGGTNGTVRVLLGLPDGSLLVAGEFTQAGGLAMNNVAIWNGFGYSALGTGVTGNITCGAVQNGIVYLGGSGLNGGNDLAHWDGFQWNYVSVFQGKQPSIFALHAIGDTLYAAGELVGFAGSDERVAYNIGTDWQLVFGTFDAPVRCLGTHEGKLVAGGDFTGITIGDPLLFANHIAILGNSGWQQLGGGLNGTVHALLDVEGTLYAGGAMLANIAPLFGLARIGPNAASWEQLMPNLVDYVSPAPGPPGVRTLLLNGGDVFIGGSFGMLQGMVNGFHLARFSGTPDSFEPLAYFNGPVNALAADPFISDAIGLYAGGEFTQNVADTVSYLAGTYLNTSIQHVPERSAMLLQPNPASDRLTITLEDGASANATIEVLDVQGRTVFTRALHGQSVTLDITTLAPGAYTVRIVGEQGIRSQTFIKH
ncbi:MAG: T9SS type A sorting domain-containing protein [Flavobacteriales bacterium]